MKVYTKTGDNGTTALIGGERVRKYDARVEAYGTVDELSAFIGLLGDKMRGIDGLGDYALELCCVNSMLMNIEAHLAAGSGVEFTLPEVSNKSIEQLERGIDEMQSQLPQIMKFTIPGGCEINSLCHVCRTICRRAERRAAEVADTYELAENVCVYLNRLSDYLYLLGRYASLKCGVEEILWIPEK